MDTCSPLIFNHPQGGRSERSWAHQKDPKPRSCCPSYCASCSTKGLVNSIGGVSFQWSHNVKTSVNLTKTTLSPGGFEHKTETTDQCSQVHAFHEGGWILSHPNQHLLKWNHSLLTFTWRVILRSQNVGLANRPWASSRNLRLTMAPLTFSMTMRLDLILPWRHSFLCSGATGLEELFQLANLPSALHRRFPHCFTFWVS